MTQPHMTNSLRAARAERALSRYRLGDDLRANLVDLLADAMHWCDYADEDFHLAFAQACRHDVHELNYEQNDERRLLP